MKYRGDTLIKINNPNNVKVLKNPSLEGSFLQEDDHSRIDAPETYGGVVGLDQQQARH